MKAIILDDEPSSIQVLRLYLGQYCPQVQVVATCSDSLAAVVLIKELRPDLLFLDIEMPQLNGFQVLDALEGMRFCLIFTTAYDQYAVKAFKYSALDYLLKPIDPDELVKTVKKATERIELDKTQLEILRMHLRPNNKKVSGKIALPNLQGYSFVEINQIVLVESDGSYSKISLANGETFFITKSIGEIETVLDNDIFFRPHRKNIVNLGFVKEYIRGDGGYLIMQNGKSIQLSRNRKDEFQMLFSKI